MCFDNVLTFTFCLDFSCFYEHLARKKHFYNHCEENILELQEDVKEYVWKNTVNEFSFLLFGTIKKTFKLKLF